MSVVYRTLSHLRLIPYKLPYYLEHCPLLVTCGGDRQQLFILIVHSVALKIATIQLVYSQTLESGHSSIPLSWSVGRHPTASITLCTLCTILWVCTILTVVIWSDMLGDIQWRKDSLSWSGPSTTLSDARHGTEIEQATECSLP